MNCLVVHLYDVVSLMDIIRPN